jgi:hypothetical protein
LAYAPLATAEIKIGENTMAWNREGNFVAGNYMGIFPYAGKISESRVKYGGKVQHTVKLLSAINVFGDVRDTILVDEEELVIV